ncbi:hypothetical protein B1757_13805 [Acidithiobacillus marinus]|uniref:Uncharacterized protein n=1 Tax=Acidithiobacillus marinus TaxID=187490 RepID=A0A2I1DIG7_9PROT|nr:hypothetical protein [Acidithiobacillus marinus]PKY09673.1 hypothetical protein B1757_13805 [Acidithiobacillus marinus]
MSEDVSPYYSAQRQELFREPQPTQQIEEAKPIQSDPDLDLLFSAVSRREEHIVDEILRSKSRADQALNLAQFAIATQLDQPAIKAIVGRALQDSKKDIDNNWEQIKSRIHRGREKQRLYQSLIRDMRTYQTELKSFGKVGRWAYAKARQKISLLEKIATVQEEALTARQSNMNIYDEITHLHEQMNRIIDDFVRLMDQALKPYRVSLLSIVPVEKTEENEAFT